jgi:hypothetical protein
MQPTGNPGDLKRDMILRYQQIQQQIHAKMSSAIVGVDSEGDEGLSMSEDDEEEEEVGWRVLQQRGVLELGVIDQF